MIEDLVLEQVNQKIHMFSLNESELAQVSRPQQ